jgi:hypothetical protein
MLVIITLQCHRRWKVSTDTKDEIAKIHVKKAICPFFNFKED